MCTLCALYSVTVIALLPLTLIVVDFTLDSKLKIGNQFGWWLFSLSKTQVI